MALSQSLAASTQTKNNLGGAKESFSMPIKLRPSRKTLMNWPWLEEGEGWDLSFVIPQQFSPSNQRPLHLPSFSRADVASHMVFFPLFFITIIPAPALLVIKKRGKKEKTCERSVGLRLSFFFLFLTTRPCDQTLRK